MGDVRKINMMGGINCKCNLYILDCRDCTCNLTNQFTCLMCLISIGYFYSVVEVDL